jgi:hypothetical protein
MDTCHLIKRIFLATLIFPIFSIFAYFSDIDELNFAISAYYVVPTIYLAFFGILLNVPCIVQAASTRELDYNDLEDKNCISAENRARFQMWIIFLGQLTYPLIISGAAYYYFYIFDSESGGAISLVGTIGGFGAAILKGQAALKKATVSVLNQIKNNSPGPNRINSRFSNMVRNMARDTSVELSKHIDPSKLDLGETRINITKMSKTEERIAHISSIV